MATFSTVLKQSFLIVCLSYLICFSFVLAFSNDNLYGSVDAISNNLNHLRFVSLVKRDTDNSSAKKASPPEKKINLKTATAEKPTTVPGEKATIDEKGKAKASIVASTTEWPDLPVSTPGNVTFENETNFNLTHYYVYYNATICEGDDAKKLWVDLDANNESLTHQMLSNSHRRAATVALSFDFPFYGYPVRNITIATGGFLYTGDYMHTWLAATQYIAPLMANFDTSIHNTSVIKYLDTGKSFTVQWENVYLQDIKPRADTEEDGPFSFQVTLFKNGDMSFQYKIVPLPITEIDNDFHPVKVGLSDAYIMEKAVVFLKKKTIYEYHRADLANHTIGNNTAIYITALPTCQSFSDCESCKSSQTSFDCAWCESAGRCSNGLDRNRQDWMSKHCDSLSRSELTCSALTPNPVPETIPTKPASTKKPTPTSPKEPTNPPPSTDPTSNPSKEPIQPTIPTRSPSGKDSPAYFPTLTPSEAAAPKVVTLAPGSGGPEQPGQAADPAARKASDEEPHPHHSKGSVGAGAVISILIIVCLVTGFGIWIIYAYKFPQSPSGQLLIRYRPSQWRWRHGEARYTAASIHI